MKKTWNNPAIDALEITATAGGPIFNTDKDGEVWWNEDEDRWETPSGEHPKSE